MIKRLTLKNFRSHKHSELVLADGVNVIVGRGQAGKTNIKRAVDWLATNRPKGQRVHSFWCEKGDATEVVVETVEGHEIGISKPMGGSVAYQLRAPGVDQLDLWDKTAGSVPDKIVDVLNISELNVQHQLDLPYLIASSTGDISRAVNAAIDLDAADQWISECGKRKTHVSTQLTALSNQLTAEKRQLVRYDALPDAHEVLQQSDGMYVEVQDAVNQGDILHTLLSTIDSAQADLDRLGDTDVLGASLEKIIATHVLLDEAIAQSEALGALLDTVDNAMCDVERLSDFGEAEALIVRIDVLRQRYDAAVDRSAKCKVVLDADTCVRDAIVSHKKIVGEYLDTLDTLGVCPTCYMPIDAETVQYVLANMAMDTSD